MKTPRLLFALLALAVPGALIAGCGDDEKSASSAEEREEAAATPQEARAEIGEVRALLAQAEAKVEAGERSAADRLVGDAYLEHFEKVEGPLEEKNHELMEELEQQIATELRDEIKAGAPPAKVARLVDEVEAGLDKAEALLGQS